MIFQPKAGQIDFTHARYCPTINCVVRYKDKILLVKRSAQMHFYPNTWSGITGFLDDSKTLEVKVQEELSEELGLGSETIASMRIGRVSEVEAQEYGKVWIVHPVLIDLDTDKTRLNWEAEEVRWIDPKEISAFECTPGFPEMVHALLSPP